MIKFRRNCKRGEGRSQGIEGAQKQGNSLAYKNFAAKIAPLQNRPPSAKPFRSPKTTLCEIFRSCKTLPRHTCAVSQPKYPFCSYETLFAAPSTLCEIILQLRNTPLAHECHFAAPHSHFAAAKWPVKWPAKSPLACEITHWLRNGPPPAKSLTVT